MRPVCPHLCSALKAIGTDVTKQSKAQSIAHFRSRLLRDARFYRDHISLYIRGLSGDEYPPGGVVVAGRDDYIHAQSGARRTSPQRSNSCG